MPLTGKSLLGWIGAAVTLVACSEAPAALDASVCCGATAADASAQRDADADAGSPPDGRADGDGARDATPPPPECRDGHGGLLVLCVQVDADDLEALYDDPEDRIEVPAAVVIEGQVYPDAELELHGGYGRSVEKKSYRLKFDSDHRPEVDYFGDGAESLKRVVLGASWIDETYARAKLLMDLTREQGGLAPRMGHGVLYINGAYQGLYILTERIDEQYLERNGFNPEGNLYKAESHNADWQIRTDPLRGFSEITHEDGIAPDLGSFFASLWGTEQTGAAFDSEVITRMDRGDWEAWHRVHTFGQNLDTFSKNYYLYHDPSAPVGTPDARFRIVMWDADTSWGRWWNGEERPTDERQWWGERNAFAERYFDGVDGYAGPYLADYAAALEGPFKPSALNERLDAIAERISEEAARDLEHWQRERDFDTELARLREAFDERHAIMDAVIGAQLEAP